MKSHIRYCRVDEMYTLSRICPKCGKGTSLSHPARFSPHDCLNKYRKGVKPSTI